MDFENFNVTVNQGLKQMITGLQSESLTVGQKAYIMMLISELLQSEYNTTQKMEAKILCKRNKNNNATGTTGGMRTAIEIRYDNQIETLRTYQNALYPIISNLKKSIGDLLKYNTDILESEKKTLAFHYVDGYPYSDLYVDGKLDKDNFKDYADRSAAERSAKRYLRGFNDKKVH